MPSGSIRKRIKAYFWLPIALIGLILLCTALLVFVEIGTVGTFVVSALLAITVAYLGNVIRTDLSADLVRNQARPATRELFDHSARLSELVQLAELHQQTIDEFAQGGYVLDQARVSDWFAGLGFALRQEISSTASAIENWGDLAEDVLDDERARYVARLSADNVNNQGEE